MKCSLSSKNSPRNTVDFEAACSVYIRFRGVNGYYGQALPGLNLAYTVHLGGYYTNNFYDRWTFTDTTGNYNSTSGIIINTIRANQPLYKALYNPFYPRSPFYGRLFMW